MESELQCFLGAEAPLLEGPPPLPLEPDPLYGVPPLGCRKGEVLLGVSCGLDFFLPDLALGFLEEEEGTGLAL